MEYRSTVRTGTRRWSIYSRYLTSRQHMASTDQRARHREVAVEADDEQIGDRNIAIYKYMSYVYCGPDKNSGIFKSAVQTVTFYSGYTEGPIELENDAVVLTGRPMPLTHTNSDRTFDDEQVGDGSNAIYE